MTDIRVQNELNDAIVQSSDVTRIELPTNLASNVSLNNQPDDVVSYSRRGNDLVLELANGETVIIENFFVVPQDGEKNRLFFGEDDPLIEALYGNGSGVQFVEIDTVASNVGLIFEEGAGAALLSGAAGAGLGSSSLLAIGGGIAALAGFAGGGDGLPAPSVDTSDGTVITGVSNPNATVTVVANGETLTATADANGNYFVVPSSPLADGTPITATQTLGGNTSGPGTGVVDADTTFVEINPSLAGADIVGTGEANSTVEVFDAAGNSLGTAPTDANGNWTLTPSTPLSDGDMITATLTDAGGNTATDAATVLDVAPPVVNETDGDIVTGTAEPGATVELTITPPGGSPSVVSVVADGNGNFEYTAPSTLAADTTITATQTDTDLNVSGVSNEVEVDQTPPAIEINAFDPAPAGAQAFITGTSEPGATVEVFAPNGTTSLGTTTVAADGTWRLVSSEALEDGDMISATVTDPAGNTASDTEEVILDLDGDGVRDNDDIDIDGDGIINTVEDAIDGGDADGDGIVNSRETDSDDGGMSDTTEAQHGQTPVTLLGDSDGNGLDDAYETAPGAGEGLTPVDADNNGTIDLAETDNGSDLDTDNDGIPNHIDTGGTAFISRFDYRGAGEQNGEFVEITVPDAADLDTFVLGFYYLNGELSASPASLFPGKGEITVQEIVDLVGSKDGSLANSFTGTPGQVGSPGSDALPLEIRPHPDSDAFFVIRLPVGLSSNGSQAVIDSGNIQAHVVTITELDAPGATTGTVIQAIDVGVDNNVTLTEGVASGTVVTDVIDELGGSINISFDGTATGGIAPVVGVLESEVFLNLSDFDTETSTIDFDDLVSNDLGITASDLLDTTPADNILTVLGDSGDTVEISGLTTGGPQQGGLDVYTGGGATLLIDPDIIVI